jgi:cyanophycin synthetase
MLDESHSAIIVVTLPNGSTYYFSSSLTDTSSATGYAINQNKLATYKVAERIGIPVAAYQMYNSDHPERARDFLAAQKELGHELVVKPIDRDQGNGVVVGITSERALDNAIKHALLFSNRIVLQQRFDGDDCRLAVIDGVCVAAVRRSPPSIIGDGIHTVEELLSFANADPRRGSGSKSILRPIAIADVRRFIGGKGLASVPRPGGRVILLGTANVSKGGEAEDITDQIHESYGTASSRIAKELGLDVCGVDLLCRDITGPMSAENTALIEINCAIGLRLHHAPTKGKARDVAAAIVDSFARKHRVKGSDF